MLCVTLQSFTRACAPTSGGISDMLVFDPADFDFTQGAAVAGVKPGYDAVTRRTGATFLLGAKLFVINFIRDEAEWTWKQSVKGCNVKYEHSFNFQLPENSQNLTNFQEALDAASCCCGLGMIIRTTNGKIFVAGEKYVNGVEITRFTITQNGSSGGSGKLYDDFNGGNLVLTGPYSRNLNEYVGDWADIQALVTA